MPMAAQSRYGLTTTPAQRPAQAGAPAPAIAQGPAYDSRTAAFQPFLERTLSGGYLEEGNPYQQQVTDAISRDANAAFDQQRANLARASMGVGRGGGSAWQQAMMSQNDTFSQNLADALASAQFQNYQNERGLQNQAAGLAAGQDQAIWGDVTARRGQDVQAAAAAQQAAASRAAAGASARAAIRQAELQAQTGEAQSRVQLLLGQGGLAENARQFDANFQGSPLEWAQMMGGQLNAFSGQENADNALMGQLAMGQQGNQLQAAGLGLQGGQAAAGLGQQQLGQQLAAAGLIPGLANNDLAALGLGADYASNLYGSQAGLAAARAQAGASRAATQAQQDALQYQSVMGQWNAANPSNALNTWLGQLGGLNDIAGRTTQGVTAPGQYVNPGQNPWLSAVQGGLGAYAGTQGWVNTGGAPGGFGGAGGGYGNQGSGQVGGGESGSGGPW